MWQVLRTTRSASSLVGGGHALRFEQLGHALAVIDVHLAAEGFDVKGLWSSVIHGAAYRRSLRSGGSAATPRRSRRGWLRRAALRSGIAAGSIGSRKWSVTGVVPRRERTRLALAPARLGADPGDVARGGPIIERDRLHADPAAAAAPARRAGWRGTAAPRRRLRSCLRGTARPAVRSRARRATRRPGPAPRAASVRATKMVSLSPREPADHRPARDVVTARRTRRRSRLRSA